MAPCPTLASMTRSEEHTSELQSLAYLVCRRLLEKKERQGGGDAASVVWRGRGVACLACADSRARAILLCCATSPPALPSSLSSSFFFLIARAPPDLTILPPPVRSRS